MSLETAIHNSSLSPWPVVMLAPIAGVNDRAAREIARTLGCPLTFSELISARGLRERNEGTLRMLDECRNEHPLIVQVFGSEIDSIAEAVRIVEDIGADGVNLNLGCPARKVFNHGSGCGLTLYPTELVFILRAMRGATNRHLSVKIRAGVDHRSLNYRLIGDIAQGEGCNAVIFHARTRKMGFGGQACLEWITDLKEHLKIPVIGNGDVIDARSAKRMLDETGCDGVMVGRGAYGNPWIFRETLHFLETGAELPPPGLEERFSTMQRHIDLAVQWRGERRALLEMRKHHGWYLKGMPNVRILRDKINHLESLDAVRQTLQSAYEMYSTMTWDESSEGASQVSLISSYSI